MGMDREVKQNYAFLTGQLEMETRCKHYKNKKTIIRHREVENMETLDVNKQDRWPRLQRHKSTEVRQTWNFTSNKAKEKTTNNYRGEENKNPRTGRWSNTKKSGGAVKHTVGRRKM